jgi:acyl-coenzyme A synthetase/AMP-(fatty) acid ligase
MGPELVAVIVDPKHEADLDSLAERCRNAMRGIVPRKVLRAQSLPRNPNGKIMRGAVRRAVQQQKEAGDAA